jgi:hypothetical protein
MVMTVPVGQDLVCPPLHRIYGIERLPRLLAGYAIEEQQFWWKRPRRSTWEQTERDGACDAGLGVVLRPRPLRPDAFVKPKVTVDHAVAAMASGSTSRTL